MNLQNIFSEFEKVDPEVYERMNSRRNMFRIGAKVAVAAAPLVLAASLKNAYGKTTAHIPEILNFALTLEYLEAEFYNIGMNTPGLIPGQDRVIFEEIRMHENAHVNFLRRTLQALGFMAVSKPNFDFTAKGAFPTVFSNYDVFKTVAQAFEDTGVRAYKGQAPRLIDNDVVLEAALRIHSVEARHAARVRELRGAKPWIPGMESNGVPAAVYMGESQVIQGNPPINVHAESASKGVSDIAVTEAFDEPLTKEQVLAIVAPFLA